MKKIFKAMFIAPIVAAPALSICACGENRNAMYQELKDTMITNFKEWCNHPHPTYYWGPLNKWLTEWAESKGYTVTRDNYYKEQAQAEWPEEYKNYYGNIWFDVPATAGYENYPKTILQAHMDMVFEDGGRGLDPKTTIIKPYIDNKNNTMTTVNQETSLGADDGAGGCMALSLISNPKVAHGPLRILFTADEEDGMLGAKNITDNDQDLGALDGVKYFINIDGEQEGCVVHSSGGLRYFWYGLKTGDEATVSTIDASCTKTVTLTCNGVRGGHSATNIIKHANALKCLLDVIDKSGLAVSGDNLFQLVSATTDTKVVTTIPTNVTIQFATSDANAQTKIDSAISAALEEWKGSCPDDKDLSITAAYDTPSTATKALTSAFSKTLFSFMNWFEFGVIEWLVENKTPKSSQNIGPLTIDCTQGNITNVLKFGSIYRSCIQTKLEEIETTIKTKADESLGKGHYDLVSVPPYEPVEINPLRDAIKAGYKKEARIESYDSDEHGALEISYFSRFDKNLNITSIGPTLKDCHNHKETLYLDSIIPTFKAIVYALKLLK